MFWLFTKTIFEDRFKFQPHYLIVFLLLEGLHFFGYFATDGYQVFKDLTHADTVFYQLTILPQQILVVILLGLTIHTAIKDWRSDLVESRRRFRAVFFVIGALLALAVSFSSYFQLGASPASANDLVGQIILLIIIAIVFARYFGVRDEFRSYPKKYTFASASPLIESDSTIAWI